jgi:nucleoside-diphosphate-sugar epimerase
VPEPLRLALDGVRPLPLAGAAGHTRTPTHLSDVADGIVAAMSHPRGANDDFNLAAAEELTLAEIARLCWEAAGNDPDDLELAPAGGGPADVPRRRPSAEKAERVLGWTARIGARDGIARTATWLATQQGATPA